MKKLILALFFVIILIPLYAQVQWRYDRTGIYSEETGLLKSWSANGPELLWHYNELGNGYSSATINNDKIYVTGYHNGKGYLYILNLDGKLLNKIE